MKEWPKIESVWKPLERSLVPDGVQFSTKQCLDEEWGTGRDFDEYKANGVSEFP